MSDAPFTMRPASPADREAILQLVTELDTNDYVPSVLDRWLVGGAFVAEAEGRLIGVFHMAMNADTEAYFSGMRIVRSEQGKGYGRAFCRAQLQLAHQLGCRTVYLLSEEQNQAAHRTVERNGFHELGPWRIWYDETDLRRLAAGPAEGVRAAELHDAPGILRFFAARPPQHVEAVIAAAADPWVLTTLHTGDFPELVADGNVAVVAGSGSVPEGLMACSLADGVSTLNIRFLKGTDAAVSQLLHWAGQAALRLQAERIAISLPGPQGDLIDNLGLCSGPVFNARAYRHRHCDTTS